MTALLIAIPRFLAPGSPVPPVNTAEDRSRRLVPAWGNRPIFVTSIKPGKAARQDRDLLAVAAEASADIAQDRDEGLAEWIASLPPAEKGALLTMVAGGEGTQVQSLLLRRFRGNTSLPSSHSPTAARTAAELRQAADEYRVARVEALEQARRAEDARAAAAKAAAYDKRLVALAGRREAAWQRVDDLIATKNPLRQSQLASLGSRGPRMCRSSRPSRRVSQDRGSLAILGYRQRPTIMVQPAALAGVPGN